jgi:multiple sugar transport system permease protein
VSTSTLRARRGKPPLSPQTVVLGLARRLVIAMTVIVSAGPVLYALFISVRPLSEVAKAPLNVLPNLHDLRLDTYHRALVSEDAGGFGLARFMKNSLVLASLTTIVTIAASALGAYAVVRLRFHGRGLVNGFFLAIYVFPGIVLAVPLFVVFSQIGLAGSISGLVIIYMAQTVPVAVYMLRNYVQTVPQSIEEAAMIDGCGRLGVIRRVVLPIAMPGIAATGLYVFMIAWNEFLFALLFLAPDRAKWTVSLGLRQLDDIGVSVTVLMAGSIVITLPVIALFVAAQKLIVSGLTAGAEKT